MKVIALFITLLISPVSAFAAVDMFLDIKGVEGESQDSEHAAEIDVLAWSWGMSSGPRNGACVQDLSVTKWIDGSSADLMMAPIVGEVFEQATLTVRKAGAIPLEYVVIRLKDVTVTSVSTGGSGGEDRLTENVTLNFSSATFTYKPISDDGSSLPEKTAEIIPSRTCQ